MDAFREGAFAMSFMKELSMLITERVLWCLTKELVLDTDGLRRLLGNDKSLPLIDVSLEGYEENGVLVEGGDGSSGERPRP